MTTDATTPGSSNAVDAGGGVDGPNRPPLDGDRPPPPEDPALKVRLEASKTAQERARLAFFGVTVITLAMVTATWNGYLSFYRHVAYEFANLADKSGANNQLGTQTLQKEVLAAWVRSRMINVSLLGINVGVDDAATVGAVALIVAMAWYYFVVRRENHTIGRLLFDYHKSAPAVRSQIYHSINAYTVLTNVGQSDDPIRSFTEEPVERQVRVLRFLSRYVHYLPLAGFLWLVLWEWLSLVRPSPFRPPFDKSVWTVLREGGQLSELLWLVVYRALGTAFAIPIAYLCGKVSQFAHATEDVLRAFRDELANAAAESPTTTGPAGDGGSPGAANPAPSSPAARKMV